MQTDSRDGNSANTNMKANGPGVIGHHPMYAQYASNDRVQRGMHEPFHQQMSNGRNNGGDMAALAAGMGKMGLQAPYYHPSDKINHSMTANAYDGGVPIHNGYGHGFMNNGPYLYPGQQYPSQTNQQHGISNGYGMYQPYLDSALQQLNALGRHSGISTPWAPSSRVPSGEVPSLVTPRQDSNSSQEGDAPGTPLTHYTGYGDYSNNVAVAGRSPSYGTVWSTPSPLQNGYKHQQRASISPRLQLLVQQDPAIPRAIPAPYSPVKPLDRSLENPHGITNVYIRGLQPDTTDEKLYALASRFGDIMSHKSIIDHNSGQCKGFGFVRFHSFKDAEDCIRGFHFLGYESSFARESFYAQLKKLHDDHNTNLYVSNLPKEMNEHELAATFTPHKVCSTRILRDGAGNGRGVGFARFESRDVCEEVIKNFNNTPVRSQDGEAYLIQIRYADTLDQKNLKQTTTAARQYRTAEYESVTSGRTPFMSPIGLANRNEGPGYALPGKEGMHQDFEMFMKSEHPSRTYGPRDRLTNAGDRLTNVSSHLTTPQGSVVNVRFPASEVAHVDRRDDGVKNDDKSDTQSEEPICDGAEKGSSGPTGAGSKHE